MVYPRANGSRSLAKFLAFCAINLCVLHGAQATAAATCTMVVSPGDAAVGIKIVTDSSCAAGGLGCINNDCRFCKTKDTPQSGHFLACSAIGPMTTPAPTTKAPTPAPTKAPTPAETPCPSTEAPTHAPTAAPTIAPTPAPTPSETKAGDTSSIDVCAASEGDQAVGIQAVSDDSCVNGGLGCFNGQCRFCKARDTPQSGHLTACNELDPSFPTVAPSTSSPSAAPGTTCGVSQGDFAMGVNAVVDPTCAFGGLGCYSDHCRFCKYRTTPQSDHFNDCSEYGTSAETNAPGDTPAPTGDTLAPTAETPAPTAETLAPMAETPTPSAETPAPTVDIPAPSAETPVPMAETPAPIAETPAPTAETPAPTAETPAPMAETPAPAVPDWETPTPAFDTLAPTAETPAPTADTPAPGFVIIPDWDTPAPSSDGPIGVVAEVTDTPTPCPTGPDGTPLEVTPTPSTTQQCPVPIESGNAAVGIQLIYDETCKDGGLGCIYDVCRYCQAWETSQSKHLSLCSSYSLVTPAPTAAGTVSEITPEPSADVTPTPAVTGACPVVVSQGDAAVGINIVTDASCAVGGLGCFQDVCRFCKVRETPQSKHLNPCTTATLTPGTPDVVTPVPVVADKCSGTVSEGDAAVGIDVISDATCVNGGIGCFKDVCRFCKIRDTPQSINFMVCPTATTPANTPAPADTPAPFPAYDTPAPADTPAPFPAYDTPAPADTPVPAYDTPAPTDTPAPFPANDTPVPTTEETPAPSVIGSTVSIADSICPRTVSKGDEMVGIQIVGDASCADGGIGCIDDVCRFCKVWESKQSTNFEPCSDFGLASSTTPAPATTAPTPAPLATSTTASAPSPAISLKCGTKVSDGDFKVGIDIYTDVSCVAGGVGCFQDVCRFCKHFDSNQSKHFVSCTSIDATNGNDISFVSEPTVATPVPTAATPAPAPLATSTTAVCASQVSVGDNAVGISAVADITCNKGGVGCFPDVACRYCQTADTNQSHHLLKCSDFTTTTVASVMMAATSDSALSAQFSKIMKNHTMKWVVAGAACVGVAAVVAMLALAAKRIVRRASSSSSDDENEDDEDAEEGGDVEAQEEAANLTADVSMITAQM